MDQNIYFGWLNTRQKLLILPPNRAAYLLGWRNVSRLRAAWSGQWSGVNPVTGQVEPLPEGVGLWVWCSLVERGGA